MQRLSVPLTAHKATFGSTLGWMLAAFALWVQLVSGSIALPHGMADQFADAVAASICHADNAPSTDQNAPGHHHDQDCPLCPICQVVAQAHLLLTPPGPLLGATLTFAVAVFAPSPAKFGIGQAVSASRARGPPATL